MSEANLNLNLLPSQAKFQARRMKMAKLAKKIAIGVGIVWLISGLLVFGLWWGSDLWLKKKQTEYRQSVNAYLQMSDEVVTSQLVKYRAKILGKVLADRFEYSTAFRRVRGLFDDKVKINEFELVEKTLFKVGLETSDGGEVDRIEERIEEINKGEVEGVEKIVINSVKYDLLVNKWIIGVEVYLK